MDTDFSDTNSSIDTGTVVMISMHLNICYGVELRSIIRHEV